jgi:fatty acid desaturase
MAVAVPDSLPRRPLTHRVEWPTLAVAAAVYGGFGLLTWFYQALPWWVLLPLGGYVVAWHGSVQHEVVHGHPTPWGWVNDLLVFPSLWLWLPFNLYRDSHLIHHRDEHLTDPRADPESYYLTEESWAQAGRPKRALYWVMNTLGGRLVLGPAYCAGKFLIGELRRFARGDFANLRPWLLHVAGSAVVLVWVIGVCRIPLLAYVALFAYPGLSLTLLRSYLEHQAREDVGHRTATVEAGPILSLMFLNNNLHTLHHAEPGLAWYRLPARYRSERDRLLARNGGYVMRGYAEVVARYLLWPKEPPVHPFADRGTVSAPAAPPVAAPFSAEPVV